MQAPLSPKSQVFGTRVPLNYGGLVYSEKEDAITAASTLLNAKDLEFLAVSEAGLSESGTHVPKKTKEPSSSSLKQRGEFHINIPYAYLTLVHAVWVWGEPAPPSSNYEPEGQPSTTREVESTVCLTIHMPV